MTITMRKITVLCKNLSGYFMRKSSERACLLPPIRRSCLCQTLYALPYSAVKDSKDQNWKQFVWHCHTSYRILYIVDLHTSWQFLQQSDNLLCKPFVSRKNLFLSPRKDLPQGSVFASPDHNGYRQGSRFRTFYVDCLNINNHYWLTWVFARKYLTVLFHNRIVLPAASARLTLYNVRCDISNFDIFWLGQHYLFSMHQQLSMESQ
jgi:hypothetical protein